MAVARKKEMILKGLNLNWKSFFVLLLIFSASVAIRIPNMDRPLSKHHEFVTAVSLRVLQVWDQEGGAAFNFVPAMNYKGDANKFINNHASASDGMMDAKGNYHYVSHPPLAYIIPHFVFKALRVKPSVFGLQVFHLFINFLTAICIYLIVVSMKSNRARSDLEKTALLAFILYVFSSAVLWFQMNTYMSDMLVHFFFVAGVLLGQKCLKFPSSNSWRILFTINLLLMIYTSWLGLFFAFTCFIGGITIWREQKGIQFALYSSLTSIMALASVYFQYSSINGSEAFLEHLTQRLHVRGSGMGGRSGGVIETKFSEIVAILVNYGSNYISLILAVLLLFGLRFKNSLEKSREISDFLAFALAPVLILHLALLNYSGHDFTTLYASCVLSIGLAFLLESYSDQLKYGVLTAVSAVSIGAYFYINPPGDISLSGERYDVSMKIGKRIKKEAKANEVVYLISDTYDPMIVVYAERNIVHIETKPTGVLSKIETKGPYVVFFEKDGKITHKEHFVGLP